VKAVIQRVSRAEVTVDGSVIARIGSGLCVLLGVAIGDTEEDAEYLARKITNLRILEDEEGKMNRSLKQTGGEVLVVSQFTLMADTRRGRRPSFVAAEDPERARELCGHFSRAASGEGVSVATGEFGAHMEVGLANSGPVTIIMDSRQR